MLGFYFANLQWKDQSWQHCFNFKENLFCSSFVVWPFHTFLMHSIWENPSPWEACRYDVLYRSRVAQRYTGIGSSFFCLQLLLPKYVIQNVLIRFIYSTTHESNCLRKRYLLLISHHRGHATLWPMAIKLLLPTIDVYWKLFLKRNRPCLLLEEQPSIHERRWHRFKLINH